MNKAYFKNIRSQILCLLEEANEEVLIAMAWFTNRELFKSILSCVERGLNVQLVLLDNPINFMEYAPDFNEFIKAGGTLKIAESSHGFMHNKFCVIDRQYVITGSYNWTYYAETRNMENILITDSQSVISQYTEEFQRLSNMLSDNTESPRYSWADIENISDVDLVDLNFEMKEIAKANHLPVNEVVRTNSSVTITERTLKVVSRYSIALGLCDDTETFIHRQATLPYTSATEEFYSASESISCHIFKKIADNEFITIKDADISTITHGKINQRLRVQFSLHETGDLIVTIYCVDTKLAIDVRVTDSNLLEYED